MPNPLVSGPWSIIISSTRISAAARRVSLLCYEWSLRRILTSAWSAESALPVCCGGCRLGYGNQANNYLGKFLSHMFYGSSILNAKPLGSTHMIKIRSLHMVRGYVRSTTDAAIELNTEEDVIKFNIGNERHVRDFRNKEKKKHVEGKKKKSRKAKLNELRYFRLIARRKMNSPDPEVRISYKLEKAKRKEEWLIEKLRKYELPKSPPEVHDPEILTEEEIFYLKRTGEKKKHYVPVGRRGVFGGVVLNMHLHWKNHETVKVVCRPCRPGQIHQYAEELSRLSKGIVIDIMPNNIIIFYRGKNYVQPEVMSPSDTLSKAKALEKYRYEQSLEHTSQFIEKLECELEEYLEHFARYKKMKNGELVAKGIEE